MENLIFALLFFGALVIPVPAGESAWASVAVNIALLSCGLFYFARYVASRQRR